MQTSGSLRWLICLMFLIVGIIHLLPLAGVSGAERLAALYGLSINDPNLTILLRHRAVLFGLFGGFMLVAAFRPALQGLALIAGYVSVASFLWISWSVGNYNLHVARVVLADWIALGCLLVATSGMAWVRCRR